MKKVKHSKPTVDKAYYYRMKNQLAARKDKLSKVKHAILVCFDCASHFHKPTIIENDPFFKLGPNPMVICTQCVQRLKEVVEL